MGRRIHGGEGSGMQKRRFGLSEVISQEDSWFWAKRVGYVFMIIITATVSTTTKY